MAEYLVTYDDAPVEALITRLEEVISPAFFISFLGTEVEPYFHEQHVVAFSDKHTPSSGHAWDELADSTVTRRIQYGFTPDDINIRTGKMEAYLAQNGIITEEAVGAQWIWPPPGDSSVTHKVQVAQEGKSNTPARPVIEATETDLAEILVLFEEFLAKVLNAEEIL